MDFSWDKVKGFFRRQTQSFNQGYRGVVEPTKDDEFDNLSTIVDGLAAIARRTVDRLRRLSSAITVTVDAVHEASLDPPASAFVWDDMEKLNKKLSTASTSLQPHAVYFKKVLVDHTTQLERFVADVRALEPLKVERASTLLEFDFFKHKVAGLRADPPSDPQRIPRNEGRVKEFGDKVEGLTTKLKQALIGLVSTGERLCSTAHHLIGAELHRFADESSRAWANATAVAAQQQAAAAAPLPSAGPTHSTAALAAAQAQSPLPPVVGNNNTAAAAASTTPTATDGLAPAPPQPANSNQTDNRLTVQQNLEGTTSSVNFASTYSYDPNRPASVPNPKSQRNLVQSGADDPFKM